MHVKARHKSISKYLPWAVIIDGLNKRNWSLDESSSSKKIFIRGNEKILVVKLGPNKWKAEYFVGRRLQDISGVAEEEFVKKMVFEMGWLK